MAKSIKLGADTYLDASGVEMYSSNAAYRQPLSEWADGLRGVHGLSILNGETLNFTIANDTRAFLVMNGVAASAKRLMIIAVTGSGVVSYNCIPDTPTNIQITTGSNSLAITNNTGGAMQPIAFIRQGSITT